MVLYSPHGGSLAMDEKGDLFAEQDIPKGAVLGAYPVMPYHVKHIADIKLEPRFFSACLSTKFRRRGYKRDVLVDNWEEVAREEGAQVHTPFAPRAQARGRYYEEYLKKIRKAIQSKVFPNTLNIFAFVPNALAGDEGNVMLCNHPLDYSFLVIAKTDIAQNDRLSFHTAEAAGDPFCDAVQVNKLKKIQKTRKKKQKNCNSTGPGAKSMSTTTSVASRSSSSALTVTAATRSPT